VSGFWSLYQASSSPLVSSFLTSLSLTSGIGTAIGEIPPYWLTRAARQAAIEAGEKTDVPEELEANSQYNFINRLKGAASLLFPVTSPPFLLQAA
jgi:hypothetical protein